MEPTYTREDLWERFLERHLATAALVAEHLRINPLNVPLLDMRLQLSGDGHLPATADPAQLQAYLTHCVVEALPQVVEAFLQAACDEESALLAA